MPEPVTERGFVWGLIRFVLSIACVVAGCVLAQGNGTPPFFYVLFAVFALPVLAAVGGRLIRRRRRLAEVLVLISGGVACSVICYTTRRRPADEVFTAIFGRPPPPGVTDLHGRVQWFDGRIHLADFTIDDHEFVALARASGLKQAETDGPNQTPDVLRAEWRRRFGTWARIAHAFWPIEPPLRSADLWNKTKASDSYHLDTVDVVREPESGRTWAVRLRN